MGRQTSYSNLDIPQVTCEERSWVTSKAANKHERHAQAFLRERVIRPGWTLQLSLKVKKAISLWTRHPSKPRSVMVTGSRLCAFYEADIRELRKFQSIIITEIFIGKTEPVVTWRLHDIGFEITLVPFLFVFAFDLNTCQPLITSATASTIFDFPGIQFANSICTQLCPLTAKPPYSLDFS